MDNLAWLSWWFSERCDGEWESDFGVTIESVNNPGWMVRIDLDGTGLDPDSFKPLADQRTDTDWVECKVEDGVWLGGGGIENLDEVLGIFRGWVDGGETGGRKSHAPAHKGPRSGPRGEGAAPRRGGPPRHEGKKPFKPFHGGGKGGRSGGGGKFRGPRG